MRIYQMIAKDLVNSEKKIYLIKILSLIIVFYSLLLPILSNLGFISHYLLQDIMCLCLWLTGFASLLFLKKYPQQHKSIFIVILITSYIISTLSLIYSPSDSFRAIWFHFIVIISFYIGRKRYGLLLRPYHHKSFNIGTAMLFLCINSG